MISAAEDPTVQYREDTIAMLHRLGICVYRQGYKALTIAVPCYARDNGQSLSKEVYPHVAACLGCGEWHAVERAVRLVILDGWERRNPAVWEEYFPNQKKAPSNKHFLAVLAERLQ